MTLLLFVGCQRKTCTSHALKLTCYLYIESDSLSHIVQSWVKIMKGLYEIWFQIWKLWKKIKYNSFSLQSDDWIPFKEWRKLYEEGFGTKG